DRRGIARVGELVEKPVDAVADKRRMGFCDHPTEWPKCHRQRPVILVWHRTRIEEIRRVVQLDLRDRLATLRQGASRRRDLRRDGTGPRGAGGGGAPSHPHYP